MILSIEKTRTDRHRDNMVNFVTMLEHRCDSVIEIGGCLLDLSESA